MPDVGSKTGAMSKLIGLTSSLQRTTKIGRFGSGLFTMSTKNTTKTCSNCYGYGHSFRAVAVEHSDGITRLHHCNSCKGTGQIRV